MQQHGFLDKTWYIGTLSEIKGFDKKLISKDKGWSGLSWGSGGPGVQVVLLAQMVQAVQMVLGVSLDDMLAENG